MQVIDRLITQQNAQGRIRILNWLLAGIMLMTMAIAILYLVLISLIIFPSFAHLSSKAFKQVFVVVIHVVGELAHQRGMDLFQLA